MRAHSPRDLRHWRDALNPLLPHPLFGGIVGCILTLLLIPLLQLTGGADGTLGPSIPLFFLVPVLLAAAIGEQRAGVVVSIVAIFLWDWFFIRPYYTVTIYYPRDVLALIVFLAVALLVGQLSGVARRRTTEALQRARTSEALYNLSLALIARTDPATVLPSLAQKLRETFDLEACAVLLPDEQGRTWRTAAAAGTLPPGARVEESRNLAAVAAWVTEPDQGVRGGTGPTPGPIVYQGRILILPLLVGTRPIGALELVYKAAAQRAASREQMLRTFANGAALALEQERLAREERAAAVARESDRLKSALLSSVSHDLRTPLAGLKIAVGSLLQKDVEWSAEDRETFLRDMDREIDHLTRLVSNLLDLSRIDAGALTADKDWEDVGELIDRVTRRAALGDHPLRREGPATLPVVRLDAVQIEQVLANLLENAAKYSPPGTPITIRTAVQERPGAGRELHIAVIDRGVGIPRAEQNKIFDKFYRVAATARRTGGTGMGLAIVKGLIEANGGRVTVESRPGEGSTFTIILPIEQPRPGATVPRDEVAVEESRP